MKKYIYIGQENGKEVVIETSMGKPKNFIHLGGSVEINTAKDEEYWGHLTAAPRIEVIGTIPAYWKKGEEVQVRVITDYCFLCQSFATSKNHCSHDTVAIPIDKEPQTEYEFYKRQVDNMSVKSKCNLNLLPLSEDDTNKLCSLIETMISNPGMSYSEAIRATPIDKAVEPEHIADTGKMIEEKKYHIVDGNKYCKHHPYISCPENNINCGAPGCFIKLKQNNGISDELKRNRKMERMLSLEPEDELTRDGARNELTKSEIESIRGIAETYGNNSIDVIMRQQLYPVIRQLAANDRIKILARCEKSLTIFLTTNK